MTHKLVTTYFDVIDKMIKIDLNEQIKELVNPN